MPRNPSPRPARVNGTTPRPARYPHHGDGSERPARRYASIKATAEFFDVDQATVRRWIASGMVTGYRVGVGSVKVDLNEAEDRIVQVIPAAAAKS